MTSNDIISFNVCKVCNGAIKLISRRTFDRLSVVRCTRCKLEFVKEMSQQQEEDAPSVTDNYYANYATDNSKFNFGLDRIVAFLGSIGLNEIGKLELLDVGCGNGELLHLAQKRGFAVSGVEQNQRCVALCKQRGFDKIYDCGLDSIDQIFDIITLFDVAEHLIDPVSFFIKLHNKLKRGGIVYLETPRVSILDTYIRIFEFVTGIPGNRISGDHLQLFSDNSLFRLMKISKLDIISLFSRLSMSWSNKRLYLYNMGIKSDIAIRIIEAATGVAIKMGVFGKNKAVIIARKK